MDHVLSTEEARVLGCLLEKERTTPEDYPLTANALMRAANQTTSRDPVVSYDQGTIERTCAALKAAGLMRFVHMPSGRATTRYRHVLDEAWGLGGAELTVLGLLLLRGPQTATELKSRSDRWHGFASVDDVVATLEGLEHRSTPLVRLLERLPGQRDPRWVHLASGEPDPDMLAAAAGRSSAGASSVGTAARLDALESTVAELRAQMDELRTQLGLDAVGGQP